MQDQSSLRRSAQNRSPKRAAPPSCLEQPALDKASKALPPPPTCPVRAVIALATCRSKARSERTIRRQGFAEHAAFTKPQHQLADHRLWASVSKATPPIYAYWPN